jgi:transposase InsO family protein
MAALRNNDLSDPKATKYEREPKLEEMQIASIRATSSNPNCEIKPQYTIPESRLEFTTKTLLDSGCTRSAIDVNYVKQNQIPTTALEKPHKVLNADGSLNGYVTDFVQLEMFLVGKDGFHHREEICLQVVKLGGRHNVFIGLDWLRFHNPEVDWGDDSLLFSRCPDSCPSRSLAVRSLTEEDWDDEGFDHGWIRVIKDEEPANLSGMIPDHYKHFSRVFSAQAFDELPQHRPWDHEIKLKEGWQEDRRLRGKVYPLNPQERQELDSFIDENLKTGRIRPSKQSDTPIAAPFFFIKKKDGKLRPVQDYRRVNEWTVKDAWPIPLISDVITRIKDAKVFSKFDVRWGFNNVRIKEGDEHKAAFITHRGTFEPTVMFFGLTNSPATFQRMMDTIFHDLIRAQKIIVYLDDILVFSKDLHEHRQIVTEVLRRMEEHKLFLKPEKCQFEQPEIDFLGIQIRNGQIAMDPSKTKAIAEWPTPKTVRDVRKFIGFCNFYRAFIGDYSNLAGPMNDLTKKKSIFDWGVKQEVSFLALKEAVAKDVTLMLPVDGAPFRLETDASDFAAGAVLHQIVEGKSRPLAFFSKTFGEAERNYQIYDKEMLAVMLALDHWKHFLRNGPQFEIWCDHKNLEYFREPQKLNRRQARWYTELAEYNFKLLHKPGRLNIVADALSRRDETEKGVNDNTDVTLLHEERFDPAKPNTHLRRLSFRDEEEIIEEIRRRRNNKDEKVKEGLIKSPKDFSETNGVVTYKGLVYVPRDRFLRERILFAHHDTPLVGHPGRAKTIELITRSYWWPGLSAQVARYVRACEKCQRTKHRPGPVAAPLVPNAIPTEPWEHVTVDMIGPLPESNGYDAILVAVCRLTKATILVPSHTKQTAEGTARIFRDNVFKRFGIPKKVISDRGGQFVGGFITELYRLLGIEGNPSTAYHPMTDGQTERMNAELEKYLRLWINAKQDNWAEWLSCAEFALNNRATSTTGYSPFFLNHGRHPRTGFSQKLESPNDSVERFASRMKTAWEDAEAALKQAAEAMKAQADKHRKPSKEYSVGDLVWLEGTNIKPKAPQGTTKKLFDKRYGPFKILEKKGASAYLLKLPAQWEIHPVFNESLLTPYVPPEAEHQQRELPPPPEIVGDHLEHDVEEILDSRKRGRGVQYLVKWTGYGHEENTWEPSTNLTNAPEAIAEFHRRNKGKPGAISPLPLQSSKRRTFARTIFPPNFFKKLTEPVDETLPSENECAKRARTSIHRLDLEGGDVTK